MINSPILSDLTIKIFADGADLESIREVATNPLVKGFTTNPTLMLKAGVADYATFAREVLDMVPDRPISFEVFADDFAEMEDQALEIASWGRNVNIKIPVTNTRAESSAPLVGRLSRQGITVNVTAVFTLNQVSEILAVLDPEVPAIISIFAGRIADSGRDPIPHMKEVVKMTVIRPKCEVLWASPREVLNILHADSAGCHIITIGSDLLTKLSNFGKDLGEISLATVKMFHDDAKVAGYSIRSKKS